MKTLLIGCLTLLVIMRIAHAEDSCTDKLKDLKITESEYIKRYKDCVELKGAMWIHSTAEFTTTIIKVEELTKN